MKNASTGDPAPVEQFQYFFHPDQIGSSNYVTDASGKVYQHIEYFPYGETWVEEKNNTQRTPYLYTGKELDEDTELYYYGARYYDPRVGQFLSGDPLITKDPNAGVSAPQLFNAYEYADSNPLAYTDPTGADPKNAVTTIVRDQPTYWQVRATTLTKAAEQVEGRVNSSGEQEAGDTT